MTKRVPYFQKAERAGDGARPVRVESMGKSLPSSRDKRRTSSFGRGPGVKGRHITPIFICLSAGFIERTGG